MSSDTPSLARRALTLTLALGVPARFAFEVRSDRTLVPLGYAAVLTVAALLTQRRTLAAQLVSRGALWANLILGALVALSSATHERVFGAQLALVAGGALLGLRRHGLEAGGDDARFVPRAFRTTLLAVMMMALADALTLGLFGAVQVADASRGCACHDPGVAALAIPLGLTALLALGVLGLLRLRAWGLFVDLVANVALMAALGAGALRLPTPIQLTLGATAALKVLMVSPMLRAIARGEAPEATALSTRGVRAGSVAVVALMAASCYGAWVASSPLLPMR